MFVEFVPSVKFKNALDSYCESLPVSNCAEPIIIYFVLFAGGVNVTVALFNVSKFIPNVVSVKFSLKNQSVSSISFSEISIITNFMSS